MKLAYPIILIPFEDHSGGYAVEVPDLPGCVSEGKNLADALLMAEDAASGWVLSELEEGGTVPEASDPRDVQPEEDDALVSRSRSTWTRTPPNTAARPYVRTSPSPLGSTPGQTSMISTTAAYCATHSSTCINSPSQSDANTPKGKQHGREEYVTASSREHTGHRPNRQRIPE